MAFLNTLGVTHTIFQKLLNSMDLKDGTKIDKAGKLGIALQWLNSTMRAKTLCQIFGCPPSTISNTLKATLIALETCLPNHPEAAIRFPSEEEAKEFAKQIKAREPLLSHVFGFVDGVSFPMQEPSDQIEQNRYYNSWKACVSVANVFGYTPDGCIFYSKINFPGSCADAKIARGLTGKINRRLTKGYAVLADSGFPETDRIITPYKKGCLDLIHEKELIRETVLKHNAVVSIRQAAEWGMRGLQGSFARLTVPLPTNARKRRRIISICVQLYNLKTRLGGLSQIGTVYGENYNPALLHSNERIRRYYSLLNSE